MRRRRQAERSQARREPRDVAAHHRPEIGVQHHRRQPLVLAELGRDLVAGADEGVRASPRAGSRPPLLVLGPDEAVEEADRDRLDAGLAKAAAAARTASSSSGVSTSPVWRSRSGTSSRRSRGTRVGGLSACRVVEVGPLLPADLEQVAEAVGGDQARSARRDAGSARWSRPSCRGRNSRPAQPARSSLGRHAPHALLDALGDAARRIVGRGGHLPDFDPALLVEQADVGEGPAGIDADAPAHALSYFAPYGELSLTRRVT